MMRALFDAIGDGVLLHELEGRILDVNRAACERLGYTREELIGMSVADLDAPELAAQVPERSERLLREGHFLSESAHVTKAGMVIPIELDARLVEVGGTQAVLCVARDLTERNRRERELRLRRDSAEQALVDRTSELRAANEALLEQLEERRRADDAGRAARDRLMQVLTHAPATFYACEPAGDFAATFVSAGVSKMLGYRPEDFLGDPGFWASNLHPDDRARVLEELGRLHATNRWVGEYRYRARDGTFRWMHDELTLFRDASGAPKEAFGCWTDVTDRRVAVDALRASEERFRRVFEEAPMGMAISELGEPYGKLAKVNKALCTTLGYGEHELLGRTFLDITHPDDFPPTLQSSQRGDRGEGVGVRADKRLVRKNGETVHGVLAVAQLPGDPGPAIKIGMFIDTSEQLRTREELERSRDELRALWARLSEAAEAERRRFAVELHDVVGRNLATIGIHLGRVQALAPPEWAERIGPRLDESRRLLRETADRARSMMEELRPSVLEDFGLIAAIRAGADKLRALAGVELLEERYLEPTSRLPPTVEITLFQIVQEAFHNVASHSRAKRVTIEADLASDPAYLTIADDGVGFDAAAPRDSATPRGWGLVYMVERAHAIGATVSVESAPGRGTLVTLELPSPCR